MPSLREVQHAFAGALLAGDDAVLAHVRSGRFEAARHFGVYRNNVYATLTEALAAVHPVVRRLVGAEFFDHAAGRYIRAHAPRSGNLHDFGADFAAFLETFAPARGLPYLPDVARLEWAWHEAFHAAEAPALSLEALAAVAPADYPRLRFRLHPSARLLASPYPVLRIWEVNQPDYAGAATVDLDEGAQRILVIRRDSSVELAGLPEVEFALLSALADGLSLEAAAEAALVRQPDFDFPEALRRHVAEATIVTFSLV